MNQMDDNRMQPITFGIYTNIRKDIELRATRRVISLLEARGAPYYFDTQVAPLLNLEKAIGHHQVDVMLVLGGDGTILSAARKYAQQGVLLFGLNLGRMGFLLDTELRDCEMALDAILAGSYTVEERMMLSASVMQPDGVTVRNTSFALNEAVVSQQQVLRLINIEVCVNGMHVDNLFCDGVIVSTPTGSTGYSLSAGGPVVLPTLDVMLITPICAHSLTSKNLVIAGCDCVDIYPRPDSQLAMLTVDGQHYQAIPKNGSVRIQNAGFGAKFIRFTNKNFFVLLQEKLVEWNAK